MWFSKTLRGIFSTFSFLILLENDIFMILNTITQFFCHYIMCKSRKLVCNFCFIIFLLSVLDRQKEILIAL